MFSFFFSLGVKMTVAAAAAAAASEFLQTFQALQTFHFRFLSVTHYETKQK